MSFHYSPGLVADCSPHTCSAGPPSAPSSSTSTPAACCMLASEMECSSPSPCGRPWRGHVDVISGGFPCQDISAAGKGAGIDGERSGLWSEFARIIGEVRPRFAFVENSPNLVTRGLDRVLGDLAALGGDAEYDVLGAHHLGAPHLRDRFWLVAHFADADREPVGLEQGRGHGASRTGATHLGWEGLAGHVPDAPSKRLDEGRRREPRGRVDHHLRRPWCSASRRPQRATPRVRAAGTSRARRRTRA